VSPDGTTAYAIMQSPLLDKEGAVATSNALRVLRLSIDASSVPTMDVAAMYIYPVDAYTTWLAAESQDKVLVSAAYWLDAEHVRALSPSQQLYKYAGIRHERSTIHAYQNQWQFSEYRVEHFSSCVAVS
jgi:hypothetical protein